MTKTVERKILEYFLNPKSAGKHVKAAPRPHEYVSPDLHLDVAPAQQALPASVMLQTLANTSYSLDHHSVIQDSNFYTRSSFDHPPNRFMSDRPVISKHALQSPHNTVGAAALDPFGTLAMELNQENQLLVSHCKFLHLRPLTRLLSWSASTKYV